MTADDQATSTGAADSSVRLGLTMGDPGGIGAEVVLKGLDAMNRSGLEVVIYGVESVLQSEQRSLLRSQRLSTEILSKPGIVVEEVTPEMTWEEPPIGACGAPAAIAQKRALRRAMEAVDAGDIDAIVTAPWNKALFAAIDEPVVGHTEQLAEYFDVDDPVMMLGGPQLRVSLVTTHIAVDAVADALTGRDIEATTEITIRSLMERFGIDEPSVAVCGLNPHAGEEGHMGCDEIEVIEPAIEALQDRWESRGVSIEGPFPADTLFAKFRDDAPFDAVICMYHDQGLIPLKLLHFGQSANITLGLPVIRTSVDHGTAYDIAGQGVADAGSMTYALQTAASMVQRQRTLS